MALKVLGQKRLKSRNTYLSAKRQLTRLIGYFGEMRVRDITEHDWTEYLLRERRRRDRKFFDDRKYMRMVMLYALRNGIIAKKIQLPIPDLPHRAGREITPGELARLQVHAGPELCFQIEIGWKMGLRLREMLSLRWDRFDWEGGTIKLEPADTKTRRGRVVPINADLIERFRERHARRTSAFVFPAPTGDRPQYENKTAWRRCKKLAGVKARWHDLRHTSATVLLRRGVKREVVRELLGMTEKVLTDIYQHLNLDDLRRAADAMSDHTK